MVRQHYGITMAILQKTLPPDHPYIKIVLEHLDSLNKIRRGEH